MNVRPIKDVYGVHIRGGYPGGIRNAQTAFTRDYFNTKICSKENEVPSRRRLVTSNPKNATDQREVRRIEHVRSMPGLWVAWFGGLFARGSAPVGVRARGGARGVPKATITKNRRVRCQV